MTRFAKKEIVFDNKIEIKLEEASNVVSAKGPKGENTFKMPAEVKMNLNDNKISFSFQEDGIKDNAKIGLSFRMIENLIHGVNVGFKKKLEVNGVGYRWNVSGKKLNMQLGFSHDIVFTIPEGITITIEGNSLTVEGVDKNLVGLVAAKIKGYRPVEPYKGKGVKYSDQFVIRKVGKSGQK